MYTITFILMIFGMLCVANQLYYLFKKTFIENSKGYFEVSGLNKLLIFSILNFISVSLFKEFKKIEDFKRSWLSAFISIIFLYSMAGLARFSDKFITSDSLNIVLISLFISIILIRIILISKNCKNGNIIDKFLDYCDFENRF